LRIDVVHLLGKASNINSTEEERAKFLTGFLNEVEGIFPFEQNVAET
jgi:hypothetical protein